MISLLGSTVLKISLIPINLVSDFAFSNLLRSRVLEARKRGKEIVEEAIRQIPSEANVRSRTWVVDPAESVILSGVEAGDPNGPLVVLLHGFPENWYCWKALIPYLAKRGFQVFAPDMRGYALSSKPVGARKYNLDLLAADIRTMIEQSGKIKATVISHDWGVAVAWHLAMIAPAVVEKLVAINGPHPVGFIKTLRKSPKQLLMSWYIFFFQLPWVPERFFTGNPWRMARSVLNSSKLKLSPFESSFYASMWLQPGAMTSMLNYYRAMIRGGPRSKFRIVHCPALVIWGEKDFALSKEMNFGLQSKWVPNLVYRGIAECSHWTPREAPEQIITHLDKFL